MMKLVLTLAVFISVIDPVTAATPKLNATETALIQRTMSLTGNPHGTLCILPKPGLFSGADFATKVAASVTKGLAYAASERRLIIIYSSDPAFATKVITLAFGPMRKNSLRGTVIVCAVGNKNDSQIRPVVTATGAKLYVEPLP